MNCDTDHVTIELQPFVHQVGGHNVVLQLNESTICKPYLDREVNFYKHLPDDLKEFTPPFQGEMVVRCHSLNGNFVFRGDIEQKTLNKCLRHVNSPHAGIPQTRSNKSSHSNKCRRRQNADGVPDASLKQLSRSPENQIVEDWSHKCIERHIKSWKAKPSQKFIVLGNLLESYSRPCTMDLKMGTKQHADIATEEKRKLLEERCANSTSSTLGFRINGSQVHKAHTNCVVSRDKYFGRLLDASGVHLELYDFFHDGVSLRYDVIRVVVRKLKSLHKVLTNQKTFCFMSCSLLLLYDSEPCIDSGPCIGQNKLLNVETQIQDFTYPSCSNAHNLDLEMSCINSFDESDYNNQFEEANLSVCKADVRLIDFAHTVLKQDMGEAIVGNQVDLLEGLTNLMSILEQILNS